MSLASPTHRPSTPLQKIDAAIRDLSSAAGDPKALEILFNEIGEHDVPSRERAAQNIGALSVGARAKVTDTLKAQLEAPSCYTQGLCEMLERVPTDGAAAPLLDTLHKLTGQMDYGVIEEKDEQEQWKLLSVLKLLLRSSRESGRKMGEAFWCAQAERLPGEIGVSVRFWGVAQDVSLERAIQLLDVRFAYTILMNAKERFGTKALVTALHANPDKEEQLKGKGWYGALLQEPRGEMEEAA
jgi:hypothetical protein